MEIQSDVRSGTDADVDFGAGDPVLRALVQDWVEELDGSSTDKRHELQRILE